MGSGNRIGRSRGYGSFYNDSRFARAGCVGSCATSFVSFGIFLLFAGGGLLIFSSVSDEFNEHKREFNKKWNSNSNSFFGGSQNTNDEDLGDTNKVSTRCDTKMIIYIFIWFLMVKMYSKKIIHYFCYSSWRWSAIKIIAIIILALGAILLIIGIALCIYVCKTVPKLTTSPSTNMVSGTVYQVYF